MTCRPSELPHTEQRPLPRSATVLGLGRTGVPVALYLSRHGVDVLATDARKDLDPQTTNELLAAGVHLELGANRVREGDLVVISPGIKPASELFKEAHASGAEVISEPELFARCFDGPIVAVTGTDGKSTVTTWAAHLLMESGIDARAGGNLGNPLIADLDDPPEVAVVEISAFQLVTTPTLRPAAAAVTNLADDHLDYFSGDRQAYFASKRHLVDLCGPGSAVVLPGGSSGMRDWPIPEGATLLRTGLDAREAPAAYPSEGLLCLRVARPGGSRPATHEPLVAVDELPLAGRHNQKNALMAAALARWAGATHEGICKGLRSYRPLAHRCQPVATIRGVHFVNDSKATNPHAASAALVGLDGPLVLIAGGSDKGTDFTAFGKLLSERTRALVATGDTAPKLLAAVPTGFPAQEAGDLDGAIRIAFEQAKPGDTVLLSPACASFDRFRSFEHRGEVFCDLVERLRDEIGGCPT
jgi:UDP-N-acetylmuramoylalanine--D-glutamate ligase